MRFYKIRLPISCPKICVGKCFSKCPANTCSMSTIETLEEVMKYVQS